MTITVLLYVLATISFLLAAGNVGRVGWVPLGYAFLTMSLFVR